MAGRLGPQDDAESIETILRAVEPSTDGTPIEESWSTMADLVEEGGCLARPPCPRTGEAQWRSRPAGVTGRQMAAVARPVGAPPAPTPNGSAT